MSELIGLAFRSITPEILKTIGIANLASFFEESVCCRNTSENWWEIHDPILKYETVLKNRSCRSRLRCLVHRKVILLSSSEASAKNLAMKNNCYEIHKRIYHEYVQDACGLLVTGNNYGFLLLFDKYIISCFDKNIKIIFLHEKYVVALNLKTLTLNRYYWFSCVKIVNLVCQVTTHFNSAYRRKG